ANDPTSGNGTFYLTRSQAKALGVIADDLSNDGMTTFGVTNPFTFSGPIAPETYDFQGIAAHEISEILGRLGLKGSPANSFTLLDLFSYTAAGQRDLVGGPGNNFSIDNGTTLLKLFNDPTTNHLDSRDWAPGTNDAFNQFSDPSVVNPVSAVDLQLLDVIGYDLVPVPSAAVPAPVFHVVRSVVRPRKS
ncbi:MAG: NF038122 family metalloprotease, partial [Planctomycetes bacterium]|nr:NF038122 family metalloprotease [Planctomycetota bacterium]